MQSSVLILKLYDLALLNLKNTVCPQSKIEEYQLIFPTEMH